MGTLLGCSYNLIYIHSIASICMLYLVAIGLMVKRVIPHERCSAEWKLCNNVIIFTWSLFNYWSWLMYSTYHNPYYVPAKITWSTLWLICVRFCHRVVREYDNSCYPPNAPPLPTMLYPLNALPPNGPPPMVHSQCSTFPMLHPQHSTLPSNAPPQSSTLPMLHPKALPS